MRNKIFILVFIFFILNSKSDGQCPDHKQLADKIIYINDTPFIKFPVKEKIKRLQLYLDTLKNCPNSIDSNYVKLIRKHAFLFESEGDYFNAAKYLRQAIELIMANYNKPSIDRLPLISGYMWLSTFYDSLGNAPEKINAANECIEIAMKFNSISDISAVRALLIKTAHYFDVGDYHSCIEYSIRCEKYAWECANKYKLQPAYYSVVVELAFNSFGWHIEALLKLGDYQTAERVLLDKFELVKNTGLKDYQAMVFDQLAQVEMNKGDYAKALKLLKLSLKNDEEIKDYFNCKQICNNIAYNLYFKNDDDKNALVFFRKGLNYVNKNRGVDQQDSMEILNIYNRMANLYVKKNQFDSSNKYYRLSFNQLKNSGDENLILKMSAVKVREAKKVQYIETLLIDRSDAYIRQYHFTKNAELITKGINCYKIADKFLDTIKTGLTDIHSKLFWRSSAKRLYENAIDACYLQNNSSDGFYFFEKSRAVLLNDQLNEQRWLNQDDILKQSQLRRNIKQLKEQQATVSTSSKEYSELEIQIFNNNQQLEKLQDQIKNNNPLYYQSFVDKNVISIQDVRQKILNDHEGLVQLFAGDSAVYVLAITKQNAFFKKINKRLYDSLAENFGRYLENGSLLNSDYSGFSKTAYHLYSLIFQGINIPVGRMIISPDGKYFPFEALIINPQKHNYFLNDYAVSYTYSARYLLNDFQQKSISGSNSFLGIAPVEFKEKGLSTLFGSDASLNKMRKYFSNATMLTYQNASKNNFLNQFTKYGIIQLYAHAVDNGENGEPEIYFEDSTLSLSDLFYGNKPVTNLIVLSACETALGKVQSGEGVFSFNRGFAALGIPSAVSNLWKVDKDATFTLTELFYKHLRKGLPLDVALQQAKLEFMRIRSQNQNPYFWAASILVGQSEKIPFQDSSALWLIPIALLLIFAFWLDRKTFKSSISH